MGLHKTFFSILMSLLMVQPQSLPLRIPDHATLRPISTSLTGQEVFFAEDLSYSVNRNAVSAHARADSLLENLRRLETGVVNGNIVPTQAIADAVVTLFSTATPDPGIDDYVASRALDVYQCIARMYKTLINKEAIEAILIRTQGGGRVCRQEFHDAFHAISRLHTPHTTQTAVEDMVISRLEAAAALSSPKLDAAV